MHAATRGRQLRRGGARRAGGTRLLSPFPACRRQPSSFYLPHNSNQFPSFIAETQTAPLPPAHSHTLALRAQLSDKARQRLTKPHSDCAPRAPRRFARRRPAPRSVRCFPPSAGPDAPAIAARRPNGARDTVERGGGGSMEVLEDTHSPRPLLETEIPPLLPRAPPLKAPGRAASLPSPSASD